MKRSLLIVCLLTSFAHAGPIFTHSEIEGVILLTPPANDALYIETGPVVTPAETLNTPATMPDALRGDVRKGASLQKEFEGIYQDAAFPKISTGTAQNFYILNGSATLSFATVSEINVQKINPAISPTLGTVGSTDSLSTILSKIINARIVQIVPATNTGLDTTTSGSFTNTSTTVSITPKLATNQVLVVACGTGGGGTQNVVYSYTIARSGTNLGGSNGFLEIIVATGGQIQIPSCMVVLDSPSTTSSTSYTVQFKGDGIRTAFWNDTASKGSIVAIEIGQ